jgi:phenylpropionate dioxygenase-like ring-hydroxylating dioxygenase large terminal subunit
VQDILREEARTQHVPAVLLQEFPADLGSEDLPVECYYDPAFHALEAEKLWPKVWQMACREEEIPGVGDHVVYDICDYSIIVVRTAPDAIAAYHNSCLHRGTQLRDHGGNVANFRCPFHGWTWHLDGTLARVPAQWDFPHVEPEKFCLPRCQVGTWGGFVFINMDPQAPPLEEYLGVLPQHFASWEGFENRRKVMHIAKVMPCNWKLLLESFQEAYHVNGTHPQMMTYVSDENSQYDILGDHLSRVIHLIGLHSPTLAGIDEQSVAEDFALNFGFPDADTDLPEGASARRFGADLVRQRLSSFTGKDMSGIADYDALDTVFYAVFPNFNVFAVTGFPIVHRFRPNGNDPETSILEFMFLAPVPEGEGEERPAPVEVRWLASDDWSEVKELGTFGAAMNQDQANLNRVQRGVRASRKGTITLANYQESGIRNFRRTLSRYLKG